jgi:hypothetical protein
VPAQANAHLVEIEPMHASKVAPAQPVQVIGVTWAHDLFAGEQGYALSYCGLDNAEGVTLLADERSEHDEPLYVGDWVVLKRIGSRRHAIAHVLASNRDNGAALIDWVAIYNNRTCVAPAQQARADLFPPGVQARDEFYARKYPGVHAWLQIRKERTVDAYRHSLPPIDPPPQPGNGGW